MDCAIFMMYLCSQDENKFLTYYHVHYLGLEIICLLEDNNDADDDWG